MKRKNLSIISSYEANKKLISQKHQVALNRLQQSLKSKQEQILSKDIELEEFELRYETDIQTEFRLQPKRIFITHALILSAMFVEFIVLFAMFNNPDTTNTLFSNVAYSVLSAFTFYAIGKWTSHILFESTGFTTSKLSSTLILSVFVVILCAFGLAYATTLISDKSHILFYVFLILPMSNVLMVITLIKFNAPNQITRTAIIYDKRLKDLAKEVSVIEEKIDTLELQYLQDINDLEVTYQEADSFNKKLQVIRSKATVSIALVSLMGIQSCTTDVAPDAELYLYDTSSGNTNIEVVSVDEIFSSHGIDEEQNLYPEISADIFLGSLSADLGIQVLTSPLQVDALAEFQIGITRKELHRFKKTFNRNRNSLFLSAEHFNESRIIESVGALTCDIVQKYETISIHLYSDLIQHSSALSIHGDSPNEIQERKFEIVDFLESYFPCTLDNTSFVFHLVSQKDMERTPGKHFSPLDSYREVRDIWIEFIESKKGKASIAFDSL